MITILRRRFSPIAATPAVPWYGIEWDESESTRTYTRIGNLSMHASLPIQSKMLGCLLDNDGTIVKYLNTSDWTQEPRDGSMGMVMVEIPDHYRRFEREGTTCRIKLSEEALTGFVHVPKAYMSAYEAAIDRSNNKLASVVNTSTQYRGGYNASGWDSAYRTLLGKPGTNQSATNFKAYARRGNNSDWNMLVYDLFKTIVWLYVVEYANTNIQLAYNSQLTAQGYRQGGLGPGATDWLDSLSPTWSSYNSLNPTVPCGYTDSLGNGSGIVTLEVKNSSNTTVHTYNVPRYRGIENLYGHLHQLAIGAGVIVGKTSSGGTNNRLYVATDPRINSFITTTVLTGHEFRGNMSLTTQGVASTLIGGDDADIIASAVETFADDEYYNDYYGISSRSTSEAARVLLLGGNGSDGTYAGLFRQDATQTTSSKGYHIGTRLCYFPSTDYEAEYLTLKPAAAGYFFWEQDGSGTLEYSVDGGSWQTLSGGYTSLIASTSSVRFRGNLTTGTDLGVGTIRFFAGTSGTQAEEKVAFEAEGNVLSLLYGDNFVGQTTMPTGAFRSLFNNTAVTSAEHLWLPRFTTENCFYRMFRQCSSLITGPTLRARILAQGCCFEMFYECSLLTLVKILATDVSATDCLTDWLYSVASSGDFVKNVATAQNTLSAYKPSGWTLKDDA